MLVVKLEIWPGGDKEARYPIGELHIANDGTGTVDVGNYDVAASHAGMFYGKRREPYKKGRVQGFARKLSPYRLVCRALRAIGEL